jgi:DNA-directed RNA polymerase specialized sigma24 family protein
MVDRLYEMPFHAEPLTLSEDEQQELERMSLSRSLPAGDVLRARLILMLAEGRSYSEIQKRLNTTARLFRSGESVSWSSASMA